MADQMDPRHEPEQKGRPNEEGIFDKEDHDVEFEDAGDDRETDDEELDLEE